MKMPSAFPNPAPVLPITTRSAIPSASTQSPSTSALFEFFVVNSLPQNPPMRTTRNFPANPLPPRCHFRPIPGYSAPFRPISAAEIYPGQPRGSAYVNLLLKLNLNPTFPHVLQS